MKQAKKRMIWLTVAAMLITMALTACGSNSTGTSTTASPTGAAGSAETAAPETSPEPTAKVEDKKLEPVTLRWILPKIQATNEAAPVFAAANKIIQEKINATVKFDQFEFGDFEKKIGLILSTGEEADLFFTSNWVNNYYKNVTNGGLADITDLLASTPQLKAKFSDDIWNSLKIDGKIYAVPNSTLFMRKMGMLFNKELVDKYKFDYNSVKKIQDLEPFLQQIKESEPGIVPVENTGGETSSQFYQNMKNVFGWDTLISMDVPGVGKSSGTDLTVFNQFESPEFKEYVQLMRDWYKKGYIQKDATTTKANFRGEGKYAAVSDPAAYPGQDVVFSTSQAGGVPYVLNSTMDGDSALTTGSIASNLNSISKTSKNPERALMLLELINSNQELFDLLTYGIEGTNYTKNADGTIEQIKNGKYEGVYNFFLASMPTLVTKGQPLDMFEQQQKMNESAHASPFLGFVFDSEPVKVEISQLSSVITKYLGGITTGYLDTDKFYPEFIAALKKAGVDKVISEMQAQVDKWAKK